MPVTDQRNRLGDSDADGLVADVRTSDPDAATPGVVVRVAGTVGTAPAAGAATSAKQDEQTALLTTIDADTGALAGLVDATNTLLPVAVKPVATSTYAPTLFADRGASATLNVKASAGNVYSLSCYNTNAAARFIQLHNTATTPAPAAVPALEFLVVSNGHTVIGTDFFGPNGVHFSTGIAFAFSTTAGTYTAGTAGEQHTQVVYK